MEPREELAWVNEEIIRLCTLANETTFQEKSEAIHRQIGRYTNRRKELRSELGIGEMEPDKCECCMRTVEQLAASRLQFVEGTAWVCTDCGVMYQALWRVEHSRRVPNVGLFLKQIRNGEWLPPAEQQHAVELAKRARGEN